MRYLVANASGVERKGCSLISGEKYILCLYKLPFLIIDTEEGDIREYSRYPKDSKSNNDVIEITVEDFLALEEPKKIPTHKEIVDNWWLTDAGNWEKVTAYNPTERAKGNHNHCYRLDSSGWSTTSSFIGMESAEYPPEGE